MPPRDGAVGKLDIVLRRPAHEGEILRKTKHLSDVHPARDAQPRRRVIRAGPNPELELEPRQLDHVAVGQPTTAADLKRLTVHRRRSLAGGGLEPVVGPFPPQERVTGSDALVVDHEGVLARPAEGGERAVEGILPVSLRVEPAEEQRPGRGPRHTCRFDPSVQRMGGGAPGKDGTRKISLR